MYIERYRNRFIVVYQTRECMRSWRYNIFCPDYPEGIYNSIKSSKSPSGAMRSAKRVLDKTHSHIVKDKHSTFKVFHY